MENEVKSANSQHKCDEGCSHKCGGMIGCCKGKWASKCGSKCKNGGMGGCVYGLGFVGALIYFISNAPTFWVGVLGFFKAVIWPAVLVFEALTFLK
jgi:hypothetical protein